MRQEQFLGEELSAAENRMETARYEVVPCGLEATVSYGAGAAKGPAAIIAASHQLERLTNGRVPCADGIFTHAPIDCRQDIEAVMGDLRALTAAITGRGHIPVTLGGEHSVSYGAVMGVFDALDAPLGLVHVDAHADFRNAYQGHKHSHASIMHLLAQEGLPMASFGVRALAEEEEAARRAHGVITHDGNTRKMLNLMNDVNNGQFAGGVSWLVCVNVGPIVAQMVASPLDGFNVLTDLEDDAVASLEMNSVVECCWRRNGNTDV